jgi:catechol 2,3-dioxygenase
MNTASQRAGIHSIDHFALNVPSLSDAQRFLGAFGLDARLVGDEQEVEVRAADNYRWARLLSADRKSLAYLSFGCFENDLEQLKAQVQMSGATFAEPPNKATDKSNSKGFWCLDPDGNLIEVKVGPKTSPHYKIPASPLTVGADIRGAEPHAQIRQIRPRRLSHVALFTPNVPRALTFYEGGLGLKVADRVLDHSAFTYARHGSDHHLVALAHSSAPGMHHCAWEVADINEAGKGGAQMSAAGYNRNWGTGRHVLGSNYFHYVMDPWGSFWEYSADIDFISADTDWVAGNHPLEDGIYQWGPDIPDYFIKNAQAA